MEKLISISKRLDVFFKVVQKLTVVLASALVVASAVISWGLSSSADALGQGSFMLDIGPITVELAEAAAPGKGQILLFIWALVLTVLLLSALIYYAIGLIRKVLQPMTEGRPFDRDTDRPIRKLAFVFLALGIVRNIGIAVETAAASELVSRMDLTRLEGIGNVTINYSFDVGFLVLFFVFLLLAHVFRYGAELQRLSDETL